MKKVFLLAAFLGVLATARANDSAIQGTSGTPVALGSLKNVRTLRGEHPTVRMVRERVDIAVGAGNYDVVANFVFHNSGAAQTVLMGFPESASGDTDFETAKKKTTFVNFATWVDGRRMATRRVLANDPNEDYELDAFWIKSVRFGRNQTRKVRVAYRAPLGGTSMGEDFLYYDFTGGNWKGKVDESVLSIRFTQPGHYLIPNYNQQLKGVVQQGNTFLYRWRNWQAQQDFSFHFTRTLPGALMVAANSAELAQPWASWQAARVLVVKPDSRNYNPWRSPVGFAPQGVMRDGRAFVQLRVLSDHMRGKWEKRNNRSVGDAAGLYVRNGLYIAPNYGGKGILSFSPGEKKATLGAKTVTLPAAPFLAGGVLYIPLAATLQHLSGTVQINAQTRRVYFDVPV